MPDFSSSSFLTLPRAAVLCLPTGSALPPELRPSATCIPITFNTVANPLSLLGLSDSVHHDNGLSAGPRPAIEAHRDPLMVSIPTVEYNQLTRTSRRYGQSVPERSHLCLKSLSSPHVFVNLLNFSRLCANLILGGTDEETIAPLFAYLISQGSRLTRLVVKLLSEAQPQEGIDNLEQEHCFETSPESESTSPTSPLENESNGYHNRLGEWVVSQPDPPNEYPPRQSSFGSYVSTGSRAESYPVNSGRRAPREGNRTISLSNLAEGTTHQDVANMIRGGQVLDIYLRYRENTASVSFLREADAKAFMSHVRKHDLYIKQKRIDVTWNERQFTLSDHIVRKISSGATRNLVIRKCGLNHTVKSIREDLEHIHNLVVLRVEFARGDCHISTNSVTAATFARTCMMSRLKYKGSRIEHDVDECCQPLDQAPFKRLSRPKPAVKERRPSTTTNRFNLLDINHSDDEA
ncbi:unnamed protein product [Clonostachys byssicola]|uniref:Negative regulator of differentiation 1 n=1 Tax=Clonostachys byssicola TaxID=160290 RepID=A0A9N9UME6_9HYPO|nr:unnamed protein product [Clonostachys byssicola]